MTHDSTNQHLSLEPDYDGFDPLEDFEDDAAETEGRADEFVATVSAAEDALAHDDDKPVAPATCEKPAEERLVSACIRCEKCYEICPRNVIAPAHLEDGVLNMRTPTFDFSANWCDWCADEHGGTPLCVSACPTEALKLPDGATAENTIIGKAVINTDWCLAYKLIGCRFCYDACPYEAMELDENNRPVVIEDKCNGCGACESVCVSLQNGSISEGATARAIVVHPLEEVEG